MSTAFFLPHPSQAGRYTPTECTVGPWSPQHQHGGPPIALLAQALCRHESASPMDLARLTVEFLGPVPLDECEVVVRVLRPGKRVELLQGEYRVGGQSVLTAQAWRMRREPGICPAVPDPWVPPPLPTQETTRFFVDGEAFPYVRSLEWRLAEGGFDQLGPATAWARLRIPLIDGQATLGPAGLLTLLDSANGISCALDIRQWTFVPVDLTLNLHRQPVGPWFGMAARTVVNDGGIGTVHTTVFDQEGVVGRSLHTLFVRPK